MIVASPTLLAYEERVSPESPRRWPICSPKRPALGEADAEPSVVAYALTGLHRSLVAHIRAGTLAGMPNATLARGVRVQAKGRLPDSRKASAPTASKR